MAYRAGLGEKNPNAKLKDTQRAEIVRQYKLGRLQTEIAMDFGITQGAVSKIIARHRRMNREATA